MKKIQTKINYEDKYEKILRQSYVDPQEKIEYPPIAISKGNTGGKNPIPLPIGTYGNFSFISAAPKSKKTFLVSLLAASYMGCSKKYTKDLLGVKKNKKLIHYDTEQGRFHAQRTFNRVTRMCENTEDYFTYALREYSAFERLDFINWHLYQIENPGLIIIDGIADLILDSNDLVQSNKLIQHLMRWTQDLNIHIITVIHSNFNSDKATGHLGSFMEKKTETQISLDLSSEDRDLAVVKCRRSRGYPFESFAFRVESDGLPYIQDSIPSNINKESFLNI
tara:strand:- start:6422 stop:7258 length:837 start_codon:yes stop_codon:yes gene_type:complete